MKVVLKDKLLSINIKQIKDTTVCRSAYDASDLIAVPIIIPKGSFVNFVKEDVNSNIADITAIEIYGYPKTMIFTPEFWSRKPLKLNFDTSNSFITPTVDSATNEIDQLNYHIYLKNKIQVKLNGYSGSPIFFFNNSSKNWLLAGVLTAGGNDNLGDYLVIAKLSIISILKSKISF